MRVSPSTYKLPFKEVSPPTNNCRFTEISFNTSKFPLIDASVAMLLIENADPPTMNEPGVMNKRPPNDTSFIAVKLSLTINDFPTVKPNPKDASP